MKFTFLVLTFLSFSFSVRATNYYFSSSGGDDNRTNTEAQNSSTPWRTLQKLNSIFPSLKPGDSILFKRGDVFYGSIIANKSGTAKAPIVLSAYGDGNKPIISGFTQLKNWVSKGSGIYESTTLLPSEALNLVVLNGAVQEMGRYPNSTDANKGFLYYESHNLQSSITDNELTSARNWKGAELVIRSWKSLIDRATITGHSGGTLSAALNCEPNDGFGYFIQNDIRTLDRLGEWYYNVNTRKLSMFFGSAGPAKYNVQASSVDTLVFVPDENYITFQGLVLQGSNQKTMLLRYGSHIVVSNCDFSFSGIDALSANGTAPLQITSNTFNQSLSNCIDTDLGSGRWTVKDNVIKNTALFPGLCQKGNSTGYGIYPKGSNMTIESNIIDSTGYCPIRFSGDDNILIKNNFINNFNLIKDDGGGIYSWNGPKAKNRKIIGNIILNGTGAGEGIGKTQGGSTSGIYFDNDVANVEILSNTVANCSKTGIFIHNSYGITARDNTLFDNTRQICMAHDAIAPNSPLRNLNIKNNVFFSKLPSQKVSTLTSIKNDLNAVGVLDSNYYCRPAEETFINATTYVNANGVKVNVDYDLKDWQDAFVYDDHSRKTAKQIHPYKLNSLVGANKFANGKFDNDITGVYATTDKSWVNSKLDGGAFQGTVPSTSTQYQTIVGVGTVSETKKYILRFSAQSSKDTVMNVYLRQGQSPYTVLSESVSFKVGPTRKEYEFLFENPTTEISSCVVFVTKGKSFQFWLDNIQLYEANVTLTDLAKAIRFEYNASGSAKTIALDGNYIDAKNTKYSGTLNLQPFSSVVLVKDESSTVPVIVNKAPTVSLQSPLDSATFTAPAAVNITAQAQDADGHIVKVEFFRDSILIGADTVAPYTSKWNNVAAGTYKLTAKATDNSGAVTVSSPVTINVEAPKIAPTVSLTSPALYSSFDAPASITLTAAAADEDGSVRKVEFFADATLVGIDSTAPYSLVWDNVAAGTYKLTAKATDNSGLSSTSASVAVNVEVPKIAPVASLTSPEVNASFVAPASITIAANASDADGVVRRVEFYAGNALVGTDSVAPYTIVWDNVTTGAYTLTAKAVDNNDLTSISSPVTINVEAPKIAPTVSLTSPALYSSFDAPASITLTAAAADEDGSVRKVEFFADATLVGIDSTAPYSLVWDNVAAGTYKLTAKATDNSGLSSTSEIITIGVEDASASAPPSNATPSVPVNDKIITYGGAWKYLDNGTNQGTAWQNGSYNDKSWKVGEGELGYGDGDEKTVVEYGSNRKNKYITTYFRKTIEVKDTASFKGYILNLKRDDGAVVYINGVEVFRSNMPTGNVNYLTPAATAAADNGRGIQTQTLSISQLRQGTNVIAVEIHQKRASSSDISFDLELKGILVAKSPAAIASANSTSTALSQKASVNGESVQGIYSKQNLSLKAFPNPSNGYFSLALQGNNDQPVMMRVVNLAGRTIETRTGIAANGVVQFGQDLSAGIYIVQIIQGNQHAELKVTKL